MHLGQGLQYQQGSLTALKENVSEALFSEILRLDDSSGPDQCWIGDVGVPDWECHDIRPLEEN